MKNVTGYDLVKLMTGAYGTLGVLTEVSLKVLPCPETSATLSIEGLSVGQSVAAMSAALGSPFEVTGAALFDGRTALRLEGFEPSVRYRVAQLKDVIGRYGDIDVVEGAASDAIWARMSNAAPLARCAVVSRVSVQPSAAPALVAAVQDAHEVEVALDWGADFILILNH